MSAFGGVSYHLRPPKTLGAATAGRARRVLILRKALALLSTSLSVLRFLLKAIQG